MNTETAIVLAIGVMNFLAGFFEGKDRDSIGNDDRAARIIRFAANELIIYHEEIKQSKTQ